MGEEFALDKMAMKRGMDLMRAVVIRDRDASWGVAPVTGTVRADNRVASIERDRN